MSDDVSRPRQKVATSLDILSRPFLPPELAGFTSAERGAALALEAMRVDAGSAAVRAAKVFEGVAAQLTHDQLLMMQGTALVKPTMEALFSHITTAQTSAVREVAKTLSIAGQLPAYKDGMAGSVGTIRSLLQQYADNDRATMRESFADWLASTYAPIRPLAAHWDAPTPQVEEEEDYEVERTDSGIYTAKRGRGRPIGTTSVKHEEYVRVLQLFVARHDRAPSIGQLAEIIKEEHSIQVSKDTVKRYAVAWFGSWLGVRKYCWRLAQGKG